jgi:hypothetical protein
VIAIAAMIASCEKRSTKFRAHDKVTVKLTETTGEVVLRMQPFADDLYYIKVPGKKSALSREYPDWWYYGRDSDWHIEGPYHYTDLQTAR